jgi:hypothetical protein
MGEFFADWYELMYLGEFSDKMYENHLYFTIGLCMVLIPVAVLAIYYYAVNSVKVSRWWHWLLLLVVLCAINFGIAYSISYNELVYQYEQINEGFPFGNECVSFAFVNTLWTFVVSFVWSMIIKWGSKNLRRTPF